jgi:hypothetical protein
MQAAQIPTGPMLARELSSRFPQEDWLAALGRGAVLPRVEVEQWLATDSPVPPALLKAAQDIERHLDLGQPGHGDHIFRARTNAPDAPMEVDAEAGMTVTPGAKMAPSKTGSPFEMGEQEGALDPDQA